MKATRAGISAATDPSTLSLDPVHGKIRHVLSDASGELRRATEHLFQAGGKGIRPLLVLLSTQVIAGIPGVDGPDFSRPTPPPSPERAAVAADLWESVYDVAAAAEMIHVASLIHDDIIDEAQTRRDIPSVNARWSNHTAVLAGDYLFASAFGLLAAYAQVGIVTLMTEAITDMCLGEVLQREQAFDPEVTEEAYTNRVRGKTAALLSACCAAGARLAGADAATTRCFFDFGRDLGLAYQIIDDVLDLEGDPQVLGKPTGADLLQGNVTLPVIYLLRDPVWHQKLAARIKQREVDAHLVDVVKDAARRSGAVDAAKETGYRLAKRAVRRLSQCPPGEATDALVTLCSAAVERSF